MKKKKQRTMPAITLRTDTITAIYQTDYALIVDTKPRNKRWFCKVLTEQEYRDILDKIKTEPIVTLQLKERGV